MNLNELLKRPVKLHRSQASVMLAGISLLIAVPAYLPVAKDYRYWPTNYGYFLLSGLFALAALGFAVATFSQQSEKTKIRGLVAVCSSAVALGFLVWIFTIGGDIGWQRGAVESLRAIHRAELNYASAFPAAGFTCQISDLRDWQQEQSGGYSFKLENCEGSPVKTYEATARPVDLDDPHFWCMNQSGVIRFIDNTSLECFTDGKPVP